MNRIMPPKTLRWTPDTMLLIAVVLTAAAMNGTEDKPDVPYPAGFRSWQHVKSIVIGSEHKSFQNRGGIHHYYANDKAMEGYRSGKFPNGSIIVDEAVFTKELDGEAKGITAEGDRRGLDVMVKNDRVYGDTGGWGFEHFDRDSQTGQLPASARARCHACHSRQTNSDHVYSTIRK